jgi:hypothetical protein
VGRKLDAADARGLLKGSQMPDHGEKTYRGSGRLKDKKAIITGADSIGRAVALAYACLQVKKPSWRDYADF